MSLDADLIVDRRRMRRKLTFWRVVAVLVAIVAVVGAASCSPAIAARCSGGPAATIARVNIEGLIRGNQQRVEALDRLAQSNAKAVIVHINSPGGTMAGSEQLYDSLMQAEGQEADGGRGRRARGLRRLYRRAWRPTTSWRSRARSSARSA